MTPRALPRLLWIGAGAVLVAATVVALGVVLVGHFADDEARILVTVAATLYAGGTALAGLSLADRGVARPLGWLVVAAAPLSFAFVA